MIAALYNDNDRYACAWLRNLIAAGEIMPGIVDEHSIADLGAADLAGCRRVHFFAGIGGWDLALRLAGWPDDRPVWTGSCPCQPFSSAGKRKAGADGRHLWPQWFRLIRECRPDTIIGEQVEGAIGLGWLDRVFADLENEGYACGTAVLGAHSVGAPHIRQRLFWVADAGSFDRRLSARPERRPAAEIAGRGEAGAVAGATREQMGRARQPWQDAFWLDCLDGKARRVEPGTFPLADGVPARVGRLRAYGNAIVPQVAAEFIRAFAEAA